MDLYKKQQKIILIFNVLWLSIKGVKPYPNQVDLGIVKTAR